MKIAMIILGALSIGVLGYLAYVAFWGWSAVRTMPRQDMFICPKGHMVATDLLIDFLGEKYCPICFHNRLRQAEREGT